MRARGSIHNRCLFKPSAYFQKAKDVRCLCAQIGRQLFQSMKDAIRKRQLHHWGSGQTRCSQEEDQEDDQDDKGDDDLPRRRILVLKAVLRKLLVQQAGKTIAPPQLKKERPMKNLVLDIDWDTVRALQSKTDQALKKDTEQLESDVKAVFNELKTLNKQHIQEQYSTKIRGIEEAMAQ